MHILVTSVPLTVVHGEKMQEPKFWKGGIGCNIHYGFFKIAVWFFGLFLIRVGEDTNPGPVSDSTHPKEEFNIFHCNPTALIGKEHEIASWGQGVTLVSETSATARAQKIIQANLRKQSFKTFWSKPVTPYQQSKGEMRGLAGGTAIISSFPARCTLEPLPDDINESDRYTEAIIQFAPGQYMFCVALYGPVLGQRYHDSLGITNRLFSIAAQRATRFQGPSVIVGDLNCSTQQCLCGHLLSSKVGQMQDSNLQRSTTMTLRILMTTLQDIVLSLRVGVYEMH